MKTVDLFAGCGGMSLGFELEGFDIAAAFELWPAAVQCYQANFSHPVFQSDLSKTEDIIPKIKSLNPEIIIGGPPCQDFSHAGKRVEADRADLTESFAIIIASTLPPYFVMENVATIRNTESFKTVTHTPKHVNYLKKRDMD